MNLKAGLPYRLIKKRSGFMIIPGLKEIFDVDVLVMGGGISGAISAYYLIKCGIDCAVADARSIGLGHFAPVHHYYNMKLMSPLLN